MRDAARRRGPPLLEAGGRSFVNAPICKFSWTVSGPKTCRPSGTSAMPPATMRAALERVMSWSSKRMLPRTGRSVPATAFMVVDLPAPLAPMSAQNVPAATEKDTSWSTSDAP